ncbi:MAG: histidine phosphatase family protein [Acidobacteriota bacterium]
MPRVLLIRRCASTAQHPEAPLTEAGMAAADGLATQLQPLRIDAVYSSPYVRAIATIAPFADRLEFAIREEGRLCERLLAKEPLAGFPDHIRRSFDDLDYRVEGGESLREVGDRGLAALSESFGYEDWKTLKNPDLFTLEFADGKLVSYE